MKIRNEIPVVVAGGGIGGLAAALALAIKGFRVTVLEQASQFGEIGAGIQLAPNAWAVLDALQVGALVKRDAVFIEKLLLMDGISGDAVIEIPLDHRFRERYGNPYAVTHRADIHTSLLEGCQARSDLIELRTNSRVSGYAIETRGVRVDIEGDEPIEARALARAAGAPAPGGRRRHGGGGARGGRRRGRALRCSPQHPRGRGPSRIGPHVLSGGAPGPGHASRSALARGDLVGRTRHAYRPLPAARRKTFQPRGDGGAHRHTRRPQRGGCSAGGASLVSASLR